MPSGRIQTVGGKELIVKPHIVLAKFKGRLIYYEFIDVNAENHNTLNIEAMTKAGELLARI